MCNNEICVRHLNKNVEDFEAACKSLDITERYILLNCSSYCIDSKHEDYLALKRCGERC